MDCRDDKPEIRPTMRWAVTAVALLTLLARGGALWLMPMAPTTDRDDYRRLAQNLIEHGTLGYGNTPTAYRPPLYPILLAPCEALGHFSTAAIAAVHLGLGLATVWLVYRLGLRWGLGRFALLAAALVACDPILLAQSTQVMTETTAAFLAVLSLTCLTVACERPSIRNAVLSGGCLALAALCRPTFLPLILIAGFVLPAFAGTWPNRLRVAGAFAAAGLAVLAPWVARNQRQLGRPIVATTHGGYTLLLGNNPSFYDYLHTGGWGTVWDAEAFHRSWEARITGGRVADELRNDRLAYNLAWQAIRRQPGTFFYSCLVRVGRLWVVVPHQVDPREGLARRWSRYLVGVWYAMEWLLAIAGLWALWKGVPRRFREGWIWGILLVGCFTAVHALYWSNMRMRAPLMPVVALLAAAGTTWIATRFLKRKLL
ncbi:MAG: ArnT family glycosyltransferase [Planctomycetota bacterium]|jgi:4-amino-4-deoxy-L-arabinose transferase-like glycosyltransferase